MLAIRFRPLLVWSVILLLWIDLVLSYIAVEHMGFAELNPVGRLAFAGGVGALVLLKVSTSLALIAISYSLRPELALLTLSTLFGAYLGLLAWNVVVLL